jgi:uncharacterized protein DUF4280
MGDALLHDAALVQCMHMGRAQPVMTSRHVKVSGQAIVTQSDGYSISGCTLPPNSGGPCVSAQWTSAATRVKAGGEPVLLKSSQAICTPTATGLTIIQTQTRVTGT